MEDHSCDVAIVGGGPAGAATAISLLNQTSALSVIVIEASRYEEPRLGETLPPPTRTLLEHLKVWPSFERQHHDQTHGTAAAWGRPELQPNDFFFMPANIGWHIDRASFDRNLAREAGNRGATLALNTLVRDVERVKDRWRLRLSSGDVVTARFLVDATGTAALARRFGARFAETDCLVGIAGFFTDCNGDARTLVDPFDNGWWYTAGLPGQRRVVACMTDRDLARQARLHTKQEWRLSLSQTRIINRLLQHAKTVTDFSVRSASSHRLDPVGGQDWLAVGDSASRFDPLSSQGIVKALRSGIFASYAILDLLVRSDSSGLKKYARYISEEFRSYANSRLKYYQQEQRWPQSEFWRRRHAAGAVDRVTC